MHVHESPQSVGLARASILTASGRSKRLFAGVGCGMWGVGGGGMWGVGRRVWSVGCGAWGVGCCGGVGCGVWGVGCGVRGDVK